MLKKKIITVLSKNHTKGTKTLGGQSVKFWVLYLVVHMLTTTLYMAEHMYFLYTGF